MLVTYIDDCGQKHRHTIAGLGKLRGYGALIFDINKVRELELSVAKLLESKGLDAETELKWSPDAGSRLRTFTGREHLFREVIELYAAEGAKAIVVIWDEGHGTLEGESANDELMKYLFERIVTHMGAERKTLVICDQPGGGHKSISRLIEKFSFNYLQGTPYVRPEACVHNILTTPSHLCRGVQVADLIGGSTLQMVAGNHTYASVLFHSVKPMLITNWAGVISGSGLKLGPDVIRNLYHWVLGEEWLYRGGTACHLPVASWPFSEDPYNP
ncbi:DUF3800 domain-containing protein [Chromatocurvus halotolerans]|uniref:Uncharacterized protein DUF3800 n=1 Tax=Chromatocurvus halotolerans TaxID=1132028 RepID=A0A4R2KWC3_9GAMM|nr:DUF3800 domain-containing protein [Chromatocurvus halotolerans]TCO77147.1 uncharacterized protein DUF3800 [Chromatocurvus halotolerans]